jgi:hypothetical protein
MKGYWVCLKSLRNFKHTHRKHDGEGGVDEI